MKYFIASCIFTIRYPELSFRVQKYVADRFGMKILRCCIPNYMVQEFENQISENFRAEWKNLQTGMIFQPEDETYSICHNCMNITEEFRHAKAFSLWELLLEDSKFEFPNLPWEVTIQDCWRSRQRSNEQDAVRKILSRMHMKIHEAEKNHAETDFCGNSLYRQQPSRNPKLAPKFYRDGAVGKFEPHSFEEQVELMKNYRLTLPTEKVICYCHYCHEGLKLSGDGSYHLAELLF